MDDKRVIDAYHVLRNGCTEPPPAWDDLPDWVRDAMRVSYLLGKIDAPIESKAR